MTYLDIDGGSSVVHRMQVVIWSFYEELSTDGYLFKNSAAIGQDLLKPFADLYAYGRSHGIDFVTYDQVSDINNVDAVIFLDRPRSGNPNVEVLMAADIAKYLLIYECEVIKQDNWQADYHQNFDRVFTWNDALVDGQRYVKINFAIDPESPYDFATLKSAFEQRKLVTLIAGAKLLQHPNELYSHRIRTIRWFELNAIDDFDLYGVGWNSQNFPSYKGRVEDKLATLSHYRFAICYENAMQYPGYITEKILDCFRAGVVPVYGGAPNIGRWIPADCYIDITQFASYEDMYAYLNSMSSVRHGCYLDNIDRYLSSSEVYPFSTECFISTITKFITWDVQLRRKEVPEIAYKMPGGFRNDQYLCQKVDTLAIQINNAADAEIMPTSPVTKALERIAETARPDLIVYIGYGYQLPVYKRARALWQFYISHFPHIKTIFVRETEKLTCGEVVADGYDLLVGIGSEYKSGSLDYAATGVWSQTENSMVIFRQMVVYDYLLRNHPKPFFLYQTTITSVVDFRALISILDKMPASNCYAGTMARMVTPEALNGLTFTSGANSLFSRDVLALMRNRYDPDHIHTTLPNDVWQALILNDIPRISLPSFNFLKPIQPQTDSTWIRALARKMLQQGDFHFRVKTTCEEDGVGKREDVDPWIMLKIMEEILAHETELTATPVLQEKYARFIDGGAGAPLTAYSDVNFYGGPRDFPLSDIEAEIVFPDLKTPATLVSCAFNKPEDLINKTTVVTFSGGMGAQIISAAIYFRLKFLGAEVYADLSYFAKPEEVAIAGKDGQCSHWGWALDKFNLWPDSFDRELVSTNMQIALLQDSPEKLRLSLEALAQPEVRKQFDITTPLDNLKSIIAPGPFVCIHVRRGDYLNVASHVVPDHHFKSIIKMCSSLVENAVIISDSLLDDSFKNEVSPYFHQISFLDQIDAFTSHCAMRAAKILVCSNSQFSLVAAALNPDAFTIVPKHWFGENLSSYEVPINELCEFQILENNFRSI
jgi:hypothetical protein